MKRVLFVWQLGANFGHLTRLVPLALKLHEQGAKVLFAIRDLRHASSFLGAQGLSFIGAPFPPSSVAVPRDFVPVSYADILSTQGMDQLDTLLPQVEAWQTVFSLFNPDVILLDHAPVAMLAAQLAGLPRVAVGTGFVLPPLTAPFPSFRMLSAERHAARMRTEEQITHTLNKLFVSKDSKRNFDSPADIFHGTQRIFTTISALDHYGERPDTQYAGFLPAWRVNRKMDVPVWPKGRKKVLLYLQPAYPGLQHVLQVLADSGHAVIACVPGTSSASKALSAGNLNVLTSFTDLELLVTQSDLVISHGGHGLVSEAFLAGKLQLLLPTQVEQSLVGLRIESARIGKMLSHQHTAEEFKFALQALMEESLYQTNIARVGARHFVPDETAVLEMLIDKINSVCKSQ